MQELLNSKCRLFIENRDAFKSAFPFENDNLFAVCASTFIDANKVADAEQLKSIRNMLKARVGAFSNFRSNAELPLVAMLAVCDDPEERLDSAIGVYGILKKHFLSSEFLPISAAVIAGAVSSERYGEICERSKRIYTLMKKEHPFLTSSEDCIFATILALSEKSDEEIIGEAEECYIALKKKFLDKNALQSLSHVLALSDDGFTTPKDRCRDTAKLYDILKERKCRYGSGYELSTLGVLGTLPVTPEETARDLIEASEFLKTQKGYGFFGFDKQQRLLHAALIVTSCYKGESGVMSGAAVNGTLSMIASQQAATCALVAVSLSTIAVTSSVR